MKSVVALTLTVFCLSMLVDFGTCGTLGSNQDIGSPLSANFDPLASGIMNALEVFIGGAATASALAKFIIDALSVLMNAGIF